MGGNAVRLGALFGGPVLAAVLLARRPAGRRSGSLALFLAGSLYWQLNASVTQIARSVGDPSTTGRLLRTAGALAARARRRAARGSRCRRPPTTGSRPTWRPRFELARGWLRQIDTTRDDIFYDDEG